MTTIEVPPAPSVSGGTATVIDVTVPPVKRHVLVTYSATGGTMFALPNKIPISVESAAATAPVWSDAADEYERHVLTTPGVAEGFDEVYQLIEEWKRSL